MWMAWIVIVSILEPTKINQMSVGVYAVTCCWMPKPCCSFFVPPGIMGEVELSCRAYVKMYLHCCLFPRCSVNGLLLSCPSPTGGAVCVTDAVPLLHSHLPLAPITQLALTQVGREPAQPVNRLLLQVAMLAI